MTTPSGETGGPPPGAWSSVTSAVERWTVSADAVIARLDITAGKATAVIFVTSTLFALTILVLTGGGFPFERDGLTVVTKRLPATLDTLLAPFHSHFNLVPIAVWDRMAAMFGTASTFPYMVLLLATQVALATGTTALLARRIGPVYALAIGLPLGMLGSAHYDFLAPWQILFTITLLAGLVAVWASIDRRRTPVRRLVVVVALIIGVMSSNVMLFIIFAIWLWMAAEHRSRQLVETIPALVVFAIWFVNWGFGGLGSDQHFTPRILLLVVPYTAFGIASGAGGAIGLGALAGAFVLGGLAVRFRPPATLAAFLVAIVAMFAVGSLFRTMTGVEQAAGSRYIELSVYIAAFGVAAAGVRPTISASLALAIGVVAAGLNLATFGVEIRHYP